MPTVLERLKESLDRCDLDAMLECFDPDYRSKQPAHPNWGFGGKEQVLKNWTACSRAFPTSRPNCCVTAPTGMFYGASGVGAPRA